MHSHDGRRSRGGFQFRRGHGFRRPRRPHQEARFRVRRFSRHGRVLLQDGAGRHCADVLDSVPLPQLQLHALSRGRRLPQGKPSVRVRGILPVGRRGACAGPAPALRVGRSHRGAVREVPDEVSREAGRHVSGGRRDASEDRQARRRREAAGVREGGEAAGEAGLLLPRPGEGVRGGRHQGLQGRRVSALRRPRSRHRRRSAQHDRHRRERPSRDCRAAAR